MTGSENAAMRPRPVADDLSGPFWDGVASHELIVQRCRDCGCYVHPPFPECTRCRSSELGFEQVSGMGVIYERVVVESPVVTGFEDDVPYACLLVELEEQAGLLLAGNLVDADPYEARVGRRVEVLFRPESDGFTLPVFRLAGEPPS